MKFAYDGEYRSSSEFVASDGGAVRFVVEWLRTKARNALEVLGIAAFRTGFPVFALADTASYHVALVAPDDVNLSAALVRLTDSSSGTLISSGDGAGRVHLYGGSDNPADSWGFVHVEFFLRPGIVWPVLLLSAITTATIVGGLAATLWWNLPSSTDAATTLVVVLPTLFAPAVAPGPHRLVRRMFKGLRGCVFLSALVSFSAAASLALNLRDTSWVSTQQVWLVLLLVSGMVTFTTGLERSRQ